MLTYLIANLVCSHLEGKQIVWLFFVEQTQWIRNLSVKTKSVLCFVQDSGFLDGAFESQNAALVSLSRLLYDEFVKSILRIVEKLDLSVEKVTAGEEVRSFLRPC